MMVRVSRLPPAPVAWQIAQLGIDQLGSEENKKFLRGALQDRKFTPILGSECYTLGRPDSSAWKRLRDRLACLKNSIEFGEVSREFLEAFASVHGVDTIPDASPSDELSDLKEFLTFQRAVLRAAQEASAVFGSAMTKSGVSVSEIGVREVKPDGLDSLIDSLVQACMAVSCLVEAVASPFDATSVYDRLVELICELTGGKLSSQLAARLKGMNRHSKEVLSDICWRAGKVNRPKLTLDQVDWLSGLLWYSFRSGLQTYPTDSELAFQLALELPQSDKNPSLILAAEQRSEDITSRLKSWFSYYRPPDSETEQELFRKFYDRIARVLAEQFVSWSNKKDIPAMALSTTFDLELEDALNSILRQGGIDCFHVAIPIEAWERAAKKNSPPERNLRWLLGTVGNNNSVEQPTWMWFPESATNIDAYLRGPLVVKLHGSPLHVLPLVQAMEESSSYERFDYALILPESSYLYYMVLMSSLPEFCIAELKSEERVFFFVGLPVNEWNIRLRIFDNIFPDRSVECRERKAVAICPRFDPFRSAPLRALGVKRWEGSLEYFSGLL